MEPRLLPWPGPGLGLAVLQARVPCLSLYLRELPESCPQSSPRLMPTLASGTFCLAVASTSAHDVFVPSLNVRVTADDRARRGRTTFLFASTDPPFGGSCEISGALAAHGLAKHFFFFLGSTTFHSPPSCPLGGEDNWVALPAAVVAFLGRASELCRQFCRRSSRALISDGPSSSNFFSRAERHSPPPSSFLRRPLRSSELEASRRALSCHMHTALPDCSSRTT